MASVREVAVMGRLGCNMRVLMGVPSSQLTTNFSAKYQLTTFFFFFSNSQLTPNFG